MHGTKPSENPLEGRGDRDLEPRECEYFDDCDRKVDLRAEVHEDGVFSAPSEVVRICSQHILALDHDKHILALDHDKHILVYPPRKTDRYVEPQSEQIVEAEVVCGSCGAPSDKLTPMTNVTGEYRHSKCEDCGANNRPTNLVEKCTENTMHEQSSHRETRE